MTAIEKDEVRESRIEDEIIADAEDAEERALGWHQYLDEKITFPFQARCIMKRFVSPLEPGEEITIEGMGPEEECMHEMFVVGKWMDRQIAVPLYQLEALNGDLNTHQAITDWLYWIARGYEI